MSVMKMTKMYVTIAKEDQGTFTKLARLKAPQYLFLNPEEGKTSFQDFKEGDDRTWCNSLGELLDSMFADNRGLVFNIENSQNPQTAFISPSIGRGTQIYRSLSTQEFRELTELSIIQGYERFNYHVDKKGRVRRY